MHVRNQVTGNDFKVRTRGCEAGRELKALWDSCMMQAVEGEPTGARRLRSDSSVKNAFLISFLSLVINSSDFLSLKPAWQMVLERSPFEQPPDAAIYWDVSLFLLPKNENDIANFCYQTTVFSRLIPWRLTPREELHLCSICDSCTKCMSSATNIRRFHPHFVHIHPQFICCWVDRQLSIYAER